MSLLDGFEHIVEENVPLAPYTRLQIGGMGAYFAQPNTVQELCDLVRRFSDNDIAIRCIGKGSNILVPDEGFGGLVIQLSAPAFCELKVEEDRIVSGSGIQLSHFVSTAVGAGLSGPEQLVGIPGTIGGALHENTSSHGGNIGAWVKSATVITRDGQLITRSGDDLNFSYRQSSLSELAIVSAEFQFDKESSDTLIKRMQKLWIVRKSKQPLLDERCAYAFKDHGGMEAEQILERADLVGARVGGVAVSDRNPNFLVADEKATAADCLKLAELIKARVLEKMSLKIELSLQVW